MNAYDARAVGTGRNGLRYEVVLRGTTVTAAVDGLPGWSLDHADADAARCTWRLLTALTAALAAAQAMGYTDGLTGLANRAALDVELARRAGGRYGLLLVDLDGFKPVNDLFGHDAGDAVLVAVAGRLAALTPPGGLAARLGGDEFVLIAPAGLAGGLGHAVHAAIVGGPVRLDGGRQVSVGASVGVAYAGPGVPAGVVLRRADEAMYRAKAGVPSVVEYHDTDTDTDADAGGEAAPRPGVRLREARRLVGPAGVGVAR